MSDLVEWLTNILDEDEAAFDVACEAEAERCRNDGMPDMTAEDVKAYWQTLPDWAGWKFLLADIAAKRAILELHSEVRSGEPRPSPWCDADERLWPCPTVRLLASAYAARDGYREEWRP